MKKTIIIIAAVMLIATVILAVIYKINGLEPVLTFAVTCGTIAYHFCMRLIIGALFNIFMGNRADHTKKWYRLRGWEERLYKTIRVKRWKGRMPSYDPELFDPVKHTWSEIAQAMCQAELVHETIFICSFVPIVATIWFGALPVFVITSVAAAGIDLMFVIMQRYNRPRVIKLIGQEKRRKGEKYELS